MGKKESFSFTDAEIQLNDIIDFLPDATFVVDKDNRLIAWNRAMAEMSGIAAADILGRKKSDWPKPFYGHKRPVLIDLVREPDEVIKKVYPDFVRSRDTISAEIFIPGLKESGIHLWAFAKPLYNAAGDFIGAIESLRDISRLKKTDHTVQRQQHELETVNQELLSANKKLKLSEEKFSKAFNLGPVLITINRVSDSKYVAASNYFLETTGYSRAEVIGRTPFELNIWKNDADRKNLVNALAKNGAVHEVPLLFQSRDKKEYMMLYSAELVSIDNAPHIVSVAVDITDRRKAEEERDRLKNQLYQAQRMESIGRLAGGVAHDFNNLLTAIMGNTQMLMMSETDPKVRSQLEVVLKAASSAADLTRQLLAFSRKQVIEPRLMDLSTHVQKMMKMLDRLIGEDIHLSTQVKTRDAYIKADPGQVEQIVVNLAVNARDAMPDGGAIIIEISQAALDNAYCRRHPYLLPGHYVMLAVSDTGTGIEEAVIKDIFDPFFTTKPSGKGTGMGLSMVYGAVKQNSGCINVYSVPGQGTSFKIYFPKVSTDGAPLPAEDKTETATGGSETILLVEDNNMVRDLTVESLENLGYQILAAASAEAALDMAKAHRGRIHLLLTDVILPGINGRTLSEEVAATRPDTPVLFTSGYTGDLIDHHGILDPGIAFIEKPYTILALSRKIRETLLGSGKE